MADAACAMGTCASIRAPAVRQQTAGRMRLKAVFTRTPRPSLDAPATRDRRRTCPKPLSLPDKAIPAQVHAPKCTHPSKADKNEFRAAVTITFVHAGIAR